MINRIKPEMVERGQMLGIARVVEVLAVELIGVCWRMGGAHRSQLHVPRGLLEQLLPAAYAFHDIASRLLGEEVPLQPLREPGMLERILRSVRPEMS